MHHVANASAAYHFQAPDAIERCATPIHVPRISPAGGFLAESGPGAGFSRVAAEHVLGVEWARGACWGELFPRGVGESVKRMMMMMEVSVSRLAV